MIRKTLNDALGPMDTRLSRVPDLQRWVKLCRMAEIVVMQEPLLYFRLRDFERNQSGVRVSTLRLIQQEMPLVLDEFLALSSEDAYKVFNIDTHQSEIARKAAIYSEAVKKTAPAMRQWGINGLYALMGEFGDVLERECAITPRTLFALGESEDMYGIAAHTSRVYWDDGHGFSEERQVLEGMLPQYSCFSLRFTLPNIQASSIRWDPCEDKSCEVRLLLATVTYQDGMEEALPPPTHNGRAMEEGVAFDTFDPWFCFGKLGEKPIQYITLCGEWTCHSPHKLEQLWNQRHAKLQATLKRRENLARSLIRRVRALQAQTGQMLVLNDKLQWLIGRQNTLLASTAELLQAQTQMVKTMQQSRVWRLYCLIKKLRPRRRST